MEQGKQFKALYASLGFKAHEVAQLLHVSPRTVHNWVSGAVPVPFMALKLLRLFLRYELPGKEWEGWHLSAGRLYTPEGFELDPRQFIWWSLLARRAAMFDVLYHRVAGVRAQRAAGQRQAQRAARTAAAQVTPHGAAGRAAQQPGPNSFIGHFMTHGWEKSPLAGPLPFRVSVSHDVKGSSWSWSS